MITSKQNLHWCHESEQQQISPSIQIDKRWIPKLIFYVVFCHYQIMFKTLKSIKNLCGYNLPLYFWAIFMILSTNHCKMAKDTIKIGMILKICVLLTVSIQSRRLCLFVYINKHDSVSQCINTKHPILKYSIHFRHSPSITCIPPFSLLWWLQYCLTRIPHHR